MISNETKAKVYNNYTGQLCLVHKTKKVFFGIVRNTANFGNSRKVSTCSVNVIKLILRPITALTDEEKIQAGKLTYLNDPETTPDHCYLDWFNFDIKNYRDGKYKLNYDAYQYLQSIGIDLPHHLLNGKTLHECGLCLYEYGTDAVIVGGG